MIDADRGIRGLREGWNLRGSRGLFVRFDVRPVGMATDYKRDGSRVNGWCVVHCDLCLSLQTIEDWWRCVGRVATQCSKWPELKTDVLSEESGARSLNLRYSSRGVPRSHKISWGTSTLVGISFNTLMLQPVAYNAIDHWLKLPESICRRSGTTIIFRGLNQASIKSS